MAVEGASKHNHFIGIGHTRWATHGDKNDTNAHPHYDHKERIALVHNGIISNYHELKGFVQASGITPRSQTDTEIVAILIGMFLDQGESLSNAIDLATQKLEGAYSFVLISILEPENMYIFKNTGTMVIGVSDGLKADQTLEKLEEFKEIPLKKFKSSSSEQVSDEQLHEF